MHLLIRTYKTFIRSYTIKIPLIRSYTIKIPLIRSYTIKKFSYKILHVKNSSYKILHDKNSSYKILHDKNSSYKILHDKNSSYKILHDKNSVLSDLTRSKNFLLYKFPKYGIFFILRTIQSCSQAVAEKLQYATLKCQSNKEKNILYCLLRLIRYCKKRLFE